MGKGAGKGFAVWFAESFPGMLTAQWVGMWCSGNGGLQIRGCLGLAEIFISWCFGHVDFGGLTLVGGLAFVRGLCCTCIGVLQYVVGSLVREGWGGC